MTTIREAIGAYKSGVRIDNPNSRRLYHRALDAFGEYIAAVDTLDAPIQSLTRTVVVEFSAWMASDQKGYSQTTRQIYRNVLRGALRFWRTSQSGWITFTAEEDLEVERAATVGGARPLALRHAQVPAEFGDRMAVAVMRGQLPLETMARLTALRARALVFLLRATALRVGDACRLTKDDLENARLQSGRLEVRMQKTGEVAHCRLGPETIRVLDAYLDVRDDNSPWLLIQHGKSNRRRKNRRSFFEASRRGYGARLSPTMAWNIVRDVARQAGYADGEAFTSPHAFRHWHADRLIEQGVSLENVQAVLGHVNPAVTRRIYTSGPNRRTIDQAENDLQALPLELDGLL